jgi:hypothetical protein
MTLHKWRQSGRADYGNWDEKGSAYQKIAFIAAFGGIVYESFCSQRAGIKI